MRFLMVDRIVSLEVGRSAVAEKTLPPDEELFLDHFPGFPVVPGVLLTEMMAQTAGKALNAERRPRGNAMLIEVRQARFRNWVRPGEVVRMTATVEQNLDKLATVQCTATVDGKPAASAQLLFAFKPVAEFAPDYRDEVLENYLREAT